MNREIECRGGARIGWFSASWPMAAFRATREEITIDVRFSGKYTFRQDQVITIEPYKLFPAIGQGILIKHNILEYPEKIIFWIIGDSDRFIKDIRDLGFMPTASPDKVIVRSGFPIKWGVWVVVGVLWLIILGSNIWLGILYRPDCAVLKPFGFLANFFVFMFSFGALKTKFVQEIVLKPNRSIGEVKMIFVFIALMSGIFSVASLIVSIFVDISG